MQIVLNCDCGEGVGDDTAIMPHMTAANIACGSHAGDESTMHATLRLCRQHGVSAGAHPSYPDRQHFGRRVLPFTLDEISASVLAQVRTLAAIARTEGVTLTHVKPHGALYNQAAVTPAVAEAMARAVARFDSNLILVGLAGSALIEAGQAYDLRVAREAFADRTYEANGTLRSRSLPDALIEDDQRCLAQAISIITNGCVSAHNGARITVQADTICLHSDTPGAARRAARLRQGLRAAGAQLIPFLSA